MKSNLRYIIVLVSLLVMAVMIELFSPEPLDWTETFSGKSKKPYGSFLLREILPDIFPGMEVVESFDPANKVLVNAKAGMNYIIISPSFSPDEDESAALLHFIKKGNTMFIASRFFRGDFADELKLKTGVRPFTSSSSTVNFVNKRLRTMKDYSFSRMSSCYYFASFRRQRATLLGTDNEGRANLVKVRYGKGNVILSTIPLAFTNYYIADEKNYTYACRAMSYLPVKPSVWDEYYKPHSAVPATPLRYILSAPALKMAYYILITLIFVFVIFRAKRKQRIIPVIEPLPNTSRDFIETVGKLFFQEKDHLDIFKKKQLYFFEHVRTFYHIDEISFSDDFYEILSGKSGVDRESVKKLFSLIGDYSSRKHLYDNDLVKVSSLIEEFYLKAVK